MQIIDIDRPQPSYPDLAIPTPTRDAIGYGVTVRAGAVVSWTWTGRKYIVPTDAALSVLARRFDGTSITVDVDGKAYTVATGDYTENRGN